MARSARRLSSPKVEGSTTRSKRRSRSARPSNGSTYSPVSGSERNRVDREVPSPCCVLLAHGRIAGNDEAPMAAPAFDSRRGSDTSMPPIFVDLEALADRFNAAE
jgi:hypothetical protein